MKYIAALLLAATLSAAPYAKFPTPIVAGDTTTYLVAKPRLAGVARQSVAMLAAAGYLPIVLQASTGTHQATNTWIANANGTAVQQLAEIPLATAKAAKLADIDARTDSLIDAATFDYDGDTFALDKRSREKWQGIGTIGRNGGGAGQQVTKMDRTRKTFVSAAAANAFFIAGATKMAEINASAYTLIDAVLAATTTAEVAAVFDNR